MEPAEDKRKGYPDDRGGRTADSDDHRYDCGDYAGDRDGHRVDRDDSPSDRDKRDAASNAGPPDDREKYGAAANDDPPDDREKYGAASNDDLPDDRERRDARSNDDPPDDDAGVPAGEPSIYTPETPVSRDRFLSLSREYLSILKKSLLEFRARKAKGLSYIHAYSRIVDAIVGVLYQRALQESGLDVDEPELAVIALGGYGRGELAPYSDVDILVLCKRKTPVVKQIAGSFIQLMWDVGFELGHSVQSLVESESVFFKHMDARTALFESRWICGSQTVAREAERRIKKWRRQDRRAFLVRKIRDATKRHEKYGNSYQLIEPNVKLSPGGLRDYQTLVWLGMVSDRDTGLAALRRRGLLLQGETESLENAYAFLLGVRVELHIISKSKQDQLTVHTQNLITERLGYRDKGGHLAVELLMKDYYDHTRTIARITR
ncbi:MAG: nucleotidyltransferase domain-containing protein, partial [bacterium]